MAVLNAGDRQLGFAKFLAERNGERDPVECTKANGKLAFDAIDAWFDANAAAINAAIPLPARTALSTPQKARLSIAVLQQRYLSGV